MSNLFVMLYADCDMFGMLSTDGKEIHELDSYPGTYPGSHGGNDPYDYLHFNSFFIHQTTENLNGYGIIYYHDNDNSIQELDIGNINNQVFRSDISDDYYAYDVAKEHIWNLYGSEHHAVIVLAHNRDASMNPNIDDPHPFIWDYELTSNPEMPCYSFEHNGTIDESHIDTIIDWIEILFPTWLTDFPFRTPFAPGGNGQLVDSEVYFHWIMANIKSCDGNVLLGLHNAVKLLTMSDSEKNFIFSDGSALYAFRDYGGSTSNDYYLCYYDGLEEEDDNPFRAVRSDIHDSDYLTPICSDELVYIPRKGDIIRYKCFNWTTNEISGIVSGTWSSNYPYYVIGDVTVNDELTIESGVEVFFLDECEFAINGQVNLMNGSEFNLSHASSVIIDGSDAELLLDWGSTITGFTPTTYVGEESIPGDRIIAQNGGKITTDIPEHFTPGDPVVKISSSSGELWDGIFIKNPDDLDNYWFVNCDISGIRKLSIETIGMGSTYGANLNLYLTDFCNAGQIVVRDGHELTIEGSETQGYCYLQNNLASIYAYESPVYLDYVWVGGEGNGNGSGIYLYDSSRNLSKITNSNFSFNNGTGVKPNCVSFEEFSINTIEENSGFGMLCYDGTIFEDPFKNILIRNNDYAEYAGWQWTFNMDNHDDNIIIADNDYGTGSDYYLLMNINWDEQNAVDIRGTNITSIDHLYPTDSDAWTYSPGITGARELLNLASIDFANEDYSSAQQVLYQLLADYLYSPEAVTAVYYLYHIENLSTEDFAGLRDYLIGLNVDENTHLYSTVKKVSAKTLMKEKDYIPAIEQLEEIIVNSQLPDEVIAAMIDEGYCYLELADEGERALPDNCTVKTATLDDYQAKV